MKPNLRLVNLRTHFSFIPLRRIGWRMIKIHHWPSSCRELRWVRLYLQRLVWIEPTLVLIKLLLLLLLKKGPAWFCNLVGAVWEGSIRIMRGEDRLRLVHYGWVIKVANFSIWIILMTKMWSMWWGWFHFHVLIGNEIVPELVSIPLPLALYCVGDIYHCFLI